MDRKQDACCGAQTDGRRRSLLKSALGAATLGMTGGLSLTWTDIAEAAALSREQRDKLSPDDVIAMLKRGNERFRSGKTQQDYLAQKRASANGQYPAAVILGCIDSRAPAEIIFDAGIGDMFIARVAGNIANDDLLGSLEFACAVAGAKLVLVLGHTACGAIKGAIDHAQLGHLTGLLDKIKPAVDATRFDGERVSKNDAFVDAVAKTNVLQTAEAIRRGSEVLAGLEKGGKLKIAGAMYHLVGGHVEFYG
jgi:carbonic anhydrase